MNQQADLEKDPLLLVLTDALRAGPGTPEWRQAVSSLGSAGENVDEYRLLIEARETLESGKEYRSVRAGPGFTRKIITSIDQEPAPSTGKRRLPTASVIAWLAGIAIAIVVGIIVYQLYPRGGGSQSSKELDDLAHTYLANQVLGSTFDQGIPPAWRAIGSLPLSAAGGLRPGSAPGGTGGYAGGGIVSLDPLPAAGTFALQVQIQVNKSGALIPQVFVSSSNDFSADRATSPQELVWQLQGSEQSAVVGARVEKQLPAKERTFNVRMVFNRDWAIIDSNDQRLWAGQNALGGKERYVGVRFIRAYGQAPGDIVVLSVRLLKS